MVQFFNGAPVKKAPVRKRPRDPVPPSHAATVASSPAPTQVSAVSSSDELVSDADLRITIETLRRVHSVPDLFQSQRFKALRSVVFPLVAAPRNNAATCTQRVSEALADGRWADAKLTLSVMRQSAFRPKLGAVQRWVRDCDAAGADDAEALSVLDAILRVAAPEQIAAAPLAGGEERNSALDVFPPWAGCELQLSPDFPSVPTLHQPDSLEANNIRSRFLVVSHEPGAKRNPPNLHDLRIYGTNQDGVGVVGGSAIPLDGSRKRAVSRHDVPSVHGAFFLQGVFSPQEAHSIIRSAEAVGFEPDSPVTNTANSVLAHAFVWIADDAFMKVLFDRVKSHLPRSVGEGTLTGLNARFRCYRYVPGAVYRPHVDGAWPPSAVDPVTKKYQYDASGGQEWSCFTFLIYLNEGFEGGWTTFFTPSATEGKLNAHPVAPRVGSVLVFPHGETAGCLVHEGSAVLRGTKYIIRTEVEYTKGGRS